MEPFEGGPGKPSSEEGDEKLASRVRVMEITARLTSFFIVAIFVVACGGVLMIGLPWQTLLGWAVLVSPLLLLNGVLLRKMRRNQHAKLAERLSKLSVILMTIGAIVLSILSAGVSFFYCNTAFVSSFVHH